MLVERQEWLVGFLASLHFPSSYQSLRCLPTADRCRPLVLPHASLLIRGMRDRRRYLGDGGVPWRGGLLGLSLGVSRRL